MKLQDIIDLSNNMNEAAYHGNIGAMEMFKFQKVANAQQKARMKKIVAKGDWPAYKKLIHAVLGVSLH